jgi:hypothetical protein
MSQKPRPYHGKAWKRARGLHRKATSPEVRRWQLEEGIPDRPAWMPVDVYSELARRRLEQ